MRPQRLATAMLALTLGFAATVGAQQTADELYQAGLYQEEVQGDLERAVEIYQGIVRDHAGNRAVAAKAQLHIGICYETLGMQEAQRAYQRVVANFGDQSDVVRQARARLAALSQQTAEAAPTTGGPVARLLFSGMNPEDRGIDNHRAIIPAPDGHRFAYVQSETIYIRDQATGVTAEVASGGTTENLMPPVWSADGKRLAFSAQDTVTKVSVIRILDLSTRDTRAIPLPTEGEGYLVDWTRDGRFFLYNDMRARALRVLAVDDGTVTTVCDSVWPWQRATFSPDGRFVAYGYGANPLGSHMLSVRPVTGGPRHEIIESGGDMYLHPLWSPDGSAIGYQDSDGIWVVPVADGVPSGPPRLAYRTESPRWAIAWTAAGGLHYTANEQQNVPMRVEVDPATGQATGSGAQELEEYPGGLRVFSWSPDGRRVAVVGWYADLTIYSLDTKASTSYGDLEQDGGVQLFGGNWSPDGRELWYEHLSSSPGGGRSVKALDLATGTVRQLFTPTDGGGVSFSADGRTMTFVRPGSVRGAAEIVVAEAGDFDGRVVSTISPTDGVRLGRRSAPRISPQGDKVLYVVQRLPAGQPLGGAVWVAEADGSGGREVAAAASVRSATWDPSGRFIAYTGKTTNSTNTVMRVVDLETGVEHDIPVPATESRLQLMDWSQDGRFIGFIRVDYWWEYWAVDNLLGGK